MCVCVCVCVCVVYTHYIYICMYVCIHTHTHTNTHTHILYKDIYILHKCTLENTFENECLSGPRKISGPVRSVQSARAREKIKLEIKLTKTVKFPALSRFFNLRERKKSPSFSS